MDGFASCLMYNGIDWTDLMNNHAAQLVNSYRTKRLMYNGIDWTDLMNNHAAQLVNSYRTKHYAAEAVI